MNLARMPVPAIITGLQVLRDPGAGGLMAEGAFALPDGRPFDAHGSVTGYSMHTLRVTFVEMEVDEALCRARIRRCVAGYSAGHIVNPCTARSQMIGRIADVRFRSTSKRSCSEPCGTLAGDQL
jgi:CO/xanthine dehydrogenase Mo-binding subunit